MSETALRSSSCVKEKNDSLMDSALANLRENVNTLVLGYSIPRVDMKKLTALEFHRDYVSKNIPVILTGCLHDWPALKRWNLPYLSEKLGSQQVTVDITPDGRGDSVSEDGQRFVIPATRKMSVQQFADILKDKKGNQVVYCQHQNSNFSTEFNSIHEDVKGIGIAEQAFGCKPDAVNIWIGDQRSVSSLHRDPYENMYCVIKGLKRFTLLPPTDGPYLAEQDFPCFKHTLKQQQTVVNNNMKSTMLSPSPSPAVAEEKQSMTTKKKTKLVWDLEKEIDENTQQQLRVKWIPVDPDFPKRIKASARCLALAHPDKINPIRCEVKAGEVSQEGLTIAVNYWYDMHYGLTWSLLQYLEDSAKDDTESKSKLKGTIT
eukprot:jgi/Bigna1/71771/fgenesh1_pg.17_\